MELAVEKMGDVAVVTLPVDELDADNAGELKRDVAPVLDAHSKVVFDLGKLRFMDSSGLGVFLSCLRKLGAKGGELKLCSMAAPVRVVFELVRMHRILEIHASREAAVRSFVH